MDSPKKYKKEIISSEQICKDILVSLRKIIQAIAIHSKDLNRNFGLTGPQLMVLQEISAHNEMTVTKLAGLISLRQTTVTDILNRLERKGLVQRQKDSNDRRRALILLTEKCREILDNAPSPLQDLFVKRFSHINEWEKFMLMSSMRRMVDLMAVQEVQAAPILAAGPDVDSV